MDKLKKLILGLLEIYYLNVIKVLVCKKTEILIYLSTCFLLELIYFKKSMIKTGQIGKILYQNYKNIIDGIKVLENRHPYLYNKYINCNDPYNRERYVGGLLCGEACAISKFLLEKDGHNVEVW